MAIDLANLQGIGSVDADVCGPDGICAVPERIAKPTSVAPLPTKGRRAVAGRGLATRAEKSKGTPTPDPSPQGGGELGRASGKAE